MLIKSTRSIYQLKITLRDSHPPIWRCVLVPGSFSLYKLYQVIQLAMGWADSHLHQCIIDGEYYSIPSAEYRKLAPGVVLGDLAEAGVGAAICIRAKIAQPAYAGVCSGISFTQREFQCRC